MCPPLDAPSVTVGLLTIKVTVLTPPYSWLWRNMTHRLSIPAMACSSVLDHCRSLLQVTPGHQTRRPWKLHVHRTFYLRARSS